MNINLETKSRRWLRCVRRAAQVAVVAGCLGTAATARAAVPPFAVVQQAVEEHFASLKNYKEGDLVTKQDLAPLLKRLHGLGFDVRAKEQGVEVLLPEQDPVVTILRSPKGKQLMRELSAFPAAYDRLARLCKFAEGRALATKLVNGHDLKGLAELCSIDGARRLEAAFFQQACMRNFEVESGMAYTEAQYVSHLRTMHLLAEKNLSRPGD